MDGAHREHVSPIGRHPPSGGSIQLSSTIVNITHYDEDGAEVHDKDKNSRLTTKRAGRYESGESESDGSG